MYTKRIVLGDDELTKEFKFLFSLENLKDRDYNCHEMTIIDDYLNGEVTGRDISEQEIKDIHKNFFDFESFIWEKYNDYGCDISVDLLDYEKEYLFHLMREFENAYDYNNVYYIMSSNRYYNNSRGYSINTLNECDDIINLLAIYDLGIDITFFFKDYLTSYIEVVVGNIGYTIFPLESYIKESNIMTIFDNYTVEDIDRIIEYNFGFFVLYKDDDTIKDLKECFIEEALYYLEENENLINRLDDFELPNYLEESD